METIVTQMASTRTGKAVANQFIISTPEGIFFQSYNTIVAKKKDGKTYLDQSSWNYSRTTMKYLNIFLETTTQDIISGIKTGRFILTDLNN